MVDDIIYSNYSFILELEEGVPGGQIESFSSDGENYDFISTGGETITIFIG